VYTFLDNCHLGYIGCDGETGFFSDRANYIVFDENYYLNSEIAGAYGIYYCDECDEYFNSDYGCDCETAKCFEYHSNNREDFSNSSLYKIGFEVEKEDEEIKNQDSATDLFNDTGWAKEKDGSLGHGGFELISPILPLDIEKLILEQDTIVNSLYDVQSYINADYSTRCGGHINISKQGLTSIELLHSISGYLPLFYSIYEHRVKNTFSQVASLDSYTKLPHKYSSFYCKEEGILEIRIIPAVINVQNLLWRAELIRLILANSTSNHKKALENITILKVNYIIICVKFFHKRNY